MVRTFNIYDGDNLIKSGLSPLELQQLTPDTTYNLMLSASEFMSESERVPVPTFTTDLLNHLRQLQRSDFTTVNGATITDEQGGILKITSDGTQRIVMYTNQTTNNVLSTPITQGTTYTLSGEIKLDEGYSGTPSPLNTFNIALYGFSGSGTRLIFTANPIELSTTEYKTIKGTATISTDLSRITNYYIQIQHNIGNGDERFTGTMRIKNIKLTEVKE